MRAFVREELANVAFESYLQFEVQRRRMSIALPMFIVSDHSACVFEYM